MTQMQCRTEIRLVSLSNYLGSIIDRLASFDAAVNRSGNSITFQFAYGEAHFNIHPERLVMDAAAPGVEGLRRLKELLGTAIMLYAKSESPQIVWTGDLSDDSTLSSFRLLRVLSAGAVTPHMRRVRLAGDNLDRFESMNGMHIRMLFPTASNPDPVWPIAGPNGLALWPSEPRRPVARVYTIRKIDVAAGFMDVDFVVHGDAQGGDGGVGAAWALQAKIGDAVGIIGPLGRPIRPAEWYLMGCDETGLPALSRLLERLPADARGVAYVEVADASEQQQITHPAGVELHWIHRNGIAAGAPDALVRTICATPWQPGPASFGWFAAESEAAKAVREYWRDGLSYGRDQTLVTGYWRRGATGVMAG